MDLEKDLDCFADLHEEAFLLDGGREGMEVGEAIGIFARVCRSSFWK
jgi:hypothetical protein